MCVCGGVTIHFCVEWLGSEPQGYLIQNRKIGKDWRKKGWLTTIPQNEFLFKKHDRFGPYLDAATCITRARATKPSEACFSVIGLDWTGMGKTAIHPTFTKAANEMGFPFTNWEVGEEGRKTI